MLDKFQKRLTSKKGFTLIEMIVVIAIIVVLIALIAPNAAKLITTAKKTRCDANAKTVFTAANAYAIEQTAAGTDVADGEYADTSAVGTAIKTYITKDVSGKFAVKIEGGVVTVVTYKEGSLTSTYPTGSTALTIS